MKFVYVLQSADGEHYYVGVTDDVLDRLARHKAGDVTHTAKYLPWKIRVSVAFSDEARVFAFERYLKSGSGRAFAKKHF